MSLLGFTLLTRLQALLRNVTPRQSAADASSVSRVQEREDCPRATEEESRWMQNKTIAADITSGPPSPRSATEAALSKREDPGPAKSHHASAHMVSMSTSRPLKVPSNMSNASARVTSARSTNPCSGHFDFQLYRYGPSKESKEEFWREFCGQRDWEEFYPGSPVFEQYFDDSVGLHPPEGGCIYCPFKVNKIGDLSLSESLRVNARNRRDWEYRRWAAETNGEEDLLSDWRGTNSCDELHEKRKHDQLVAWGIPVEGGSKAESGVEENAASSVSSASTEAVSFCQYLRGFWSVLGMGASQLWQWICDCATVLYTL